LIDTTRDLDQRISEISARPLDPAFKGVVEAESTFVSTLIGLIRLDFFFSVLTFPVTLVTIELEAMERYPYPRRKYKKKLNKIEDGVRKNYESLCNFLEQFLHLLEI